MFYNFVELFLNICIFVGWSFRSIRTPWFGSELDHLWGSFQLVSLYCGSKVSRTSLLLLYWDFSFCRYRIEQELGTEIKTIPPQIDLAVYCQWSALQFPKHQCIYFHEKLVRKIQMYIAPIKWVLQLRHHSLQNSLYCLGYYLIHPRTCRVRFGALVMFLSLLQVVEEGFPVGTDTIQFNWGHAHWACLGGPEHRSEKTVLTS